MVGLEKVGSQMKKEYKEKKKGTNEVKLRKKRTISGTRSGKKKKGKK